MKKRLQIGIIGPEEKNLINNKDKGGSILKIAYQLGKYIAKNDALLITGGCTGVMESASQGAKTAGGITVGTPGRERFSSNDFIDVEICTPIDVGDYIFAGIWSCDAIIVLPGDAGTIAELAMAYRLKKPLIFIKGYQEDILQKLFGSITDDYPLAVATNSKIAVKIAIQLAKSSLT